MGRYDLPTVTIEQSWDQLTSSLNDPSKPEVVVHLEGEFDASSTEKLLERLKALVADRGVELTVDLSGVGFFSASTIGVIVQISEQLRKENRRFVIADPSAEVQRVFAACGLTLLFNVSPKSEFLGKKDSPRQSRRDHGQALSSWISVPPTAESNERSSTPRSVSTPAHRSVLAKPLVGESVAVVTKNYETNSVGCGWS